MLNRNRTGLCLAWLLLCGGTHVQASSLIATNIRGTDGTPSMLNVGSPEPPVTIDRIYGLALTNPDAPGDNVIWAGRNSVPDVRVGDQFFQSGAVAGPIHAEGAAASPISTYLLLEAITAGTPGLSAVQWQIQAYRYYDGLGAPTPTIFSVQQTAEAFTVLDMDLTVSGAVALGDKFVVANGGVLNWGVGGEIDIDGDGVPTDFMPVDAENVLAVGGSDANDHNDFNNATITVIGFEIDHFGQWKRGQFDITFDQMTSSNTWPGGDRFDVVPAPGIAATLVTWSVFMVHRRRR